MSAMGLSLLEQQRQLMVRLGALCQPRTTKFGKPLLECLALVRPYESKPLQATLAEIEMKQEPY